MRWYSDNYTVHFIDAVIELTKEKFSNGDKVVDYFPANLKDCFVVEEDKLYIGSVEI